jgi:hypothetical protein
MANGVLKRLAQAPTGTGTGSSATVYGPVASGKQTRVMHIHVANTGGAAQNYSAVINNGTSSFVIASGVPVQPNDPGEDEASNVGWLIKAGETLDMAYGNTLSYIVMGFEEAI